MMRVGDNSWVAECRMHLNRVFRSLLKRRKEGVADGVQLQGRGEGGVGRYGYNAQSSLHKGVRVVNPSKLGFTEHSPTAEI